MAEPLTRPEATEPGLSAGTGDPTLIDALLALSPEERLRLNDRMAQTIEELRHGFAAAEAHHAAGTPGGERR
jgi:hypothetical protein